MFLYRASLFVVAAALVSCAPSAEQIQQEFADLVAESNACSESSECVTVVPGCPLGCFVAVSRDHEAAVKARAAELIESYSSAGVSCNYLCAQAGPLTCEAGRCALGTVP